MKVYISAFALFIFSQGKAVPLEEIFVSGEEKGIEKSIGVRNASYVICPDADTNIFLSLKNDALLTRDTLNEECLFCFEGESRAPLHYTLKHLYTRSALKSMDQDMCFINVLPDRKLQFLFKKSERDSRPSLLHYHSNTKKATLEKIAKEPGDDHAWIIRPVYEFLDLNHKNIDPDTQLFKIPKKEKITSKIFTGEQITALYHFYFQDDYRKTITIEGEDDQFVYAHTPESSCVHGIYIMSDDYPLKVLNLEAFKKGRGASCKEAKENTLDGDSIDLPKGMTLFLKPDYTANQNQLPLTGLIEFKPGNSGIFYTNYENTTISLKEITKNNNENIVWFPNHAVEYKNNVIKFININKNPLLNPGSCMYLGNDLIQTGIKSMGSELAEAFRAIGLEKLGDDIVKASKNAENALIEASTTFSGAMVCSASILSNAVMFASKTLENAINLLSFSAKGISEDIRFAIPVVTQSIQDTVTILKSALVTSSDNLRKGAGDVSDALKSSFESFETAFTSISNALEKGTNDISATIREASGNFIKGMEKLENGMKKMSNTKHRVEVCAIQ